MERIGRYEVEREIGRGAMGVVYLAYDARLQRSVALKTIALPAGLDAAQRAEYRERFLREARAAAALTHPHIVTVFDADADESGDRPFIAMEYVEGPTLRDVLEDGGEPDREQVFDIVHGVAEALDAAHAAGVVHRDVKPANLIVNRRDGRVKVTDFGVARVGASELTRSGAALGSPAYMSPEQVRGKQVDGRSDLFSLAVILYEALTGTRPFEADDTAALAYAIAHETPVPVTRLAPQLPAGLDRFFDRALAKAPEDRFADASEFRDALERARAARVDLAATAVAVPAPAPDRPPAETGVPNAPAFATPLDTLLGREPWRWLRRGHVAALLLLIAALAGWALVGGSENAYLQLDAKSTVAAGELTLIVDGKQVYHRELSAPEQKKGFLKKLNPRHETFETWIEVDPGRHEIVAQVLPEDRETGYQDSVVVELEPGQTRTLRLSAGRPFGSAISLKVD